MRWRGPFFLAHFLERIISSTYLLLFVFTFFSFNLLHLICRPPYFTWLIYSPAPLYQPSRFLPFYCLPFWQRTPSSSSPLKLFFFTQLQSVCLSFFFSSKLRLPTSTKGMIFFFPQFSASSASLNAASFRQPRFPPFFRFVLVPPACISRAQFSFISVSTHTNSALI